jgi:putative endonuclease
LHLDAVIPAKAGIHFVSKLFCVYILTNKPRGTLYIGVTSNLPQRIAQHRQKLVEGFTGKYGLATLVWFEAHENAESAITREKQIKKWNRLWKLALVEKTNPNWHDVYDEIL